MSAIGIARILIAAGVLLLIQLGIGVDVCCYHPGDPLSWDDTDESGKVSPHGGIVILGDAQSGGGGGGGGAAASGAPGGSGGDTIAALMQNESSIQGVNPMKHAHHAHHHGAPRETV